MTTLPAWARRLAQAAAAFLTVLVLLACSGLWGAALVWSPADAAPLPPAPRAGTLPSRVGAPQPWTPDATADPLGAASVLYSSDSWLIDEPNWFLGLVGSATDDYRLAERFGTAGMSSVLSPDGTRLAFTEGVADLATGRETAFPEAWATMRAAPQAWSPDGTTLAVLTEALDGPGVHLRTLNINTGATAEIARMSARGALPGWAAAFSPDGSWLAFQTDDGVRIHALTPGPDARPSAPSDTRPGGGADVDLPLPPGARLAGKGAWTRDGRGLLVVSGEPCECGDHPVRWTVTTISVADGSTAGPAYRFDGAYAVRVLGWGPSGLPVIAEYEAAWNAEPTLLDGEHERDGLQDLSAVAAVRLTEAGTSRVLLTGGGSLFVGDVESVDVPDAILASGGLRPGDPPTFRVDTLLVVVLALAAVAVLVLLTVVAWWRRRRGDHFA